MTRFSIFFLLVFSPFILFAKPYYSEYVETQPPHGNQPYYKQFIVIFHGNISIEDEPKVKALEQQYLEYEQGDYLEHGNVRKRLEKKLNELGINVDVIENEDLRRSNKIPQPPEFHHMPY